MAKDELHSIASASHWFGGVSSWTVRSWLSTGWLKRTKVGRRTMIRESELQRFVEESTQRGLAGYGRRRASEQHPEQNSEHSQTETESQGAASIAQRSIDTALIEEGSDRQVKNGRAAERKVRAR